MLATFLNQNCEQMTSTEVTEIFDNVTLRFTLSSSSSAIISNLFEELKTISSRDVFELTLDIDGSEQKISNCSSVSLESLTNLLSDSELDAEERLIELKIWKNLKNNKISVYFLNEFITFLISQNMLNFLNNISKRFDSFFIFEVFETISDFGSKTIRFIDSMSLNHEIIPLNDLREKRLSLLLENSNIQGLSLKLLPDDFNFITRSNNDDLNALFDKACVALSLIYISNTSELTKDGNLNYKLSGYKTISRQDENLELFTSELEFLFKIYYWLYSDGNSSDKIGLARNVITLHTDNAGRFKFDSEVWNAIQSNYQIYLKGNIQGYLEVKNKIGELIIESSAKLYSVAEEMTGAFKNNILMILTFIIMVVLVNGLKSNGVDQIFSSTYLLVVSIISGLSILWLIMAYTEARKRFNSMSENLKTILVLNYKNVLMESEIEDSIDPVIEKGSLYFKKQVGRYSLWWLGITVVFFTSFLFANIFYSKQVEIDNKLLLETTECQVKVILIKGLFDTLLFENYTRDVQKIPFR